MDQTRRILIVGASRGIGLGLARAYAGAGWAVHATTRTPAEPGGLGRIEGDIRLYQLDVRDEAHIEQLVADLDGVSFDVLIHSAGIYRGHSPDEMMAVNAAAPIRVTERLLDNVAASEEGKIVLMSSQMGARRGSDTSLGPYGDSKAALNDALRARADAWSARGIVGVVVHPGWVRTDMGGKDAALRVEESAGGIMQLIGRLTPEMAGRFWTWDGREHAW